MQLESPKHLTLRIVKHRYRLSLLIQAIALMIVLGWWFARGIPFSLGKGADVLPGALQMLPCVSYSPFRIRDGHADINPFNPAASVTPLQIEEDLRILKTRTNCIRTYGLSQGLDAVPGVVQKLGMRMKLGVWLARDEAQNRIELDRGMALARQYKDVVDMLIVGNEVLLRRELSPKALGKALAYARQNSPVPVTYADVWEFWLRHSALAQQVDVVTVHILPYWEDDPVAVSDAVTHVLSIAAKVQQQFAGKPIWVGETGWPAAGRQRAGAVPGKVEQSRFVSELLARGFSLNYNVIEAFDQPWKRSFEGAMGGYWGLFDAMGQPRVALGGVVVEDGHWWRGPLGALIGGIAGVILSVLARARAAPLVLAGALLGALAPVQWLMSQQWDRSPREQALSGLLAAISTAVTLITFFSRLTKTHDVTRIVVLFAASTAALVLLLDARYRPFAWWWWLAPAAAIIAQRARGWGSEFKGLNEARLLSGILAVCAVLIAVTQGWRNAQALSYCALLLVLAVVAGWPSRTRTSSANNAAGAQSSVV